jgi:hypothetical protein
MFINAEWLEGTIRKELTAQIKKVTNGDYKNILTAKLAEADCIVCLNEVASETAEALYNEANNQDYLPIGRIDYDYQDIKTIKAGGFFGLMQKCRADGAISADDFNTLVNHKNKEDIKIFITFGRMYFVTFETISTIKMYDTEIEVAKVICEITPKKSGCNC